MLSEWGVMTSNDGLIVNYYGPGAFHGRLRNGTPVGLRWETDYPLSGHVRLVVETAAPHRFPLRLRIPAWSLQTRFAAVSGGRIEAHSAKPGRYVTLDREWRKGDTVTLEFDMRLRAVAGEREAAGHVSIYRGPLLLAFDPHYNMPAEHNPPSIALSRLGEGAVVHGPRDPDGTPWLLVDIPTSDGRSLRLKANSN